MKVINFLKKEKWTVLSVMLTLICVFVGGGVLMADATVITPGSTPSPGNAGEPTQLPGSPTTVSGVSDATGGVGGGNLIQPDIDDDIFLIGTDETVLDGIMRKAKKKVRVTGFEVDHFVIDEQKSSVFTTEDYTSAGDQQAPISVPSDDRGLFQENGTVLVKGVNGYTEDGKTEIKGVDLMLFITGKDSSGKPIVMAINGPKTNEGDAYCKIPSIPKGTEIVILTNACAETQKEVAPDVVFPTPKRVYLQKTIMNEVVSDYFDAQKKRIPFNEAQIAEAMIKQHRRKNNRSLWVSHKGKLMVDRGKMGRQLVYTTEGIRWQFKREYEHIGPWTFADIIALAKLKFTGQNCSKEAWWLMGRDLLEQIQNIDFTKHKDITMTSDQQWGFSCTKLHTVFGDFYLKHEPTLDYLGYSCSGGILDMSGIVRYYIKNEETSSEKIEGEEAKRKAIISINALALKGYSHIWVNGEDIDGDNIPGASAITNWSNATDAPENPKLNDVIYLTVACAGITASKAGDIYQYNGTSWEKYSGVIYAQN
ncbi:SU10 major capsid protein [Bacteroides cellulosilyticus]|jgi:hypothetical protein|uniref:SU10 major capsid protein n=1 Tax=Bacteroides cellulosilyticus TaxID=246787 RepID=UPI00095DD6E4|nr:hypothetical protein [Bacteroides oleiciplenus]OKZ08865.1 MAG: hypothetical protein BHV75_13790 [Bacteroides oleiciplenus]DAF18103.1 MAG TPA: hypothetical protein [Caudoviricetes sp.]DAT08681.1 MAG TPA: hypothetical protein [Caudoviricetes sp.]DAU89233.1 MAG TPA: hypothetical protein [Caudoviricetes sp.]